MARHDDDTITTNLRELGSRASIAVGDLVKKSKVASAKVLQSARRVARDARTTQRESGDAFPAIKGVAG
jgi:hypothetical protein